ncbi:MAG: hypothetical protein J6M06_03860 [Synergistaceae bacterium]|nr:hypothetical protein [Synergistaceae bacterium]
MQETNQTNQIAATAPKKKRRGCLIPILIFFIVIFGIGILVAVSSEKASAPKSLLAETLELSETQEEAVLAIFEKCGIGEITEASVFQAGEDRTSYYVNDEETAYYSGADNSIVVWIDNKTKGVDTIYFHDNDIFENGAALHQVSEYYVPKALRDEYRVSMQLLVKQCLNYPDSAKFESGGSKWSFGVIDGLDVIQSTVKAKNAFGMESTERFQVKVDRSSGKPVSLIIGDTEYLQS